MNRGYVVADQESDDLLRSQSAIGGALCYAFEEDTKEKGHD